MATKRGNVTNKKGTPGYANWMRKTADYRKQLSERMKSLGVFALELKRLLEQHVESRQELMTADMAPGPVDHTELLEYLCDIASIPDEVRAKLGLRPVPAEID